MKTFSSTTPSIMRRCAGVALIAAALGTSACEVKKTQEGEMPKVHVEGGQAPKYDVKGPDVSVETKEKTIKVPEVHVTTPQEKRQQEEAAANATPATPAPPTTPPPPATPAPPPAQ